jgi:L-asparaginase II
MTRGRRTQAAELEVRLLREGIIESRHFVQAVICDNRGRNLLVAGSAETATFVRSALKPFQALAVTTTGTLERYGLTDRDLAIICSSQRERSSRCGRHSTFSGVQMLTLLCSSALYLLGSAAAWNITVLVNTLACLPCANSEIFHSAATFSVATLYSN